MRKILHSQDQTSSSTFRNVNSAKSVSFVHKRNHSQQGSTLKPLIQYQEKPKKPMVLVQEISQHNYQIPSLRIISKNSSTQKIKQKNVSIYGTSQSPDPFKVNNQSQITVQSYLSSKKLIYKKKNLENYESQIMLYDKALKSIIISQDQDELKDFDKRYERCVRSKRFREIIHVLLEKSKEQQVSLQDLIDNKITQHKPYQQHGSFGFLFYVRKGMIDQIEQLLQLNPLFVHDFDEKEQTALHIATQKQYYQIVKILLSYGANVLSRDLKGLSSLNYAINSQLIDIISLFLSIQCPSDVQYIKYFTSTNNLLIKQIIKKNKLQEIKQRIIKSQTLIDYFNNLIDFINI